GSGFPHVAYKKVNGSQVNYTYKTGGGWQPIETIQPSSRSVGGIALAIDPANESHVAFIDFGSVDSRVRAADRTGGNWGVGARTIATGGGQDLTAVSIAATPQSKVWVGYTVHGLVQIYGPYISHGTSSPSVVEVAPCTSVSIASTSKGNA